MPDTDPAHTDRDSSRLAGLRPAGVLRRLLAFAMDGALLAPLLVVLGWVWVRLFQIALPSANLPLYDWVVQLYLQDDPLVIGGLLFLITAVGAYFLVAQLIWGATVGMGLLGLEVVGSDGAPAGPGACTTRVLGAGLSTAYFGLGLVWIAFDSRRQGLHDKIADTLVIRRKTR